MGQPDDVRLSFDKAAEIYDEVRRATTSGSAPATDVGDGQGRSRFQRRFRQSQKGRLAIKVASTTL